MFSQTAFLLVFGLGAVCVALGFFLVVRGIGASDSESSVKVVGLELRASRVGPGVLFAMFGVVLIVVALAKQPSGDAPSPTPTPAPTPTPNPTPAPGPKTDPNPPAPTPVDPMPAPVVVSEPTNAVDQRHNREIQLIRQFFAGLSNGVCDASVLGPAPLQDCQIHIQFLQQRMYALGPVQGIAFLASAQSPFGPADRFAVQHANAAVTWTGVLGADGRFITLTSP